MEEKVNYTMVGMIVLILLATFVIASLWLSVGLEKKKHNFYMVYMSEAVSGLSKDDQVKFNGVPVGYVKKISLNNQNPQQVKLLLSIDATTPITTSTTATLIPRGITGNSFVGLTAKSADLTPLQRRSNQPYPIIPAKPSLFSQLDEISTNINAIAINLKKFFNTENATHLKVILNSIDQFTLALADNSAKIRHSLDSADIFLANASQVSKEFPTLIYDLHTAIKKIAPMAIAVTNAGNKVADTMSTGKRTIHRISGEAAPLGSIFTKLNVILTNIEQMSNQMRQNPAVIIRGNAPPRPGPGE